MSNYNSNLQTNNADLQAILDAINALPEVSNGAELPELTNEGTAADLLSGKQLIDGDGHIVEGTIATRTSNDLILNSTTAIVTVPSGYYATPAIKNFDSVVQATPSIAINASGLITATATQTGGYVSAGTKSATKQLAFQAAKTITPNTASQIAVSSGYYTGGDVVVDGDPNLRAANIKSGVSIFGVSGTYVGSGSEGEPNYSVEDNLVTRQLTTYTNNRVTDIGSWAFQCCSKLTAVSFPKATTIGNSAFYMCPNLATVSFPQVTNIGSNAFGYCLGLLTASFPQATSIGSSAFASCTSLITVSCPLVTSINSSVFNGCTSLTTVSFPMATIIGAGAFSRCYNLKSLYLAGSSLCQLFASNAFTSTPIGGYSASAKAYGSIFVPGSLVNAYKSATNWTYFSSRITAIPGTEEGGGDGGDTGGNSSLTTFTYASKTYQKDPGMTWAEWVNSSYNTEGFTVDADGVLDGTEEYVSAVRPADMVLPSDVIYDCQYVKSGMAPIPW